MKYLISIALGPVQGFIAAARKTRDLYAGSWILSETSKAAAVKLLDLDAELIFPSADRADLARSDFRAVNKLLAIVETEAPSFVAAEVKAAGEERLREIADIGNIDPVEYDRTATRLHVDNFLELYAAWAPSGPDYKADRNQVENLLASRKLLNDFEQHRGEGGKQKSSIDGVRETVIERRGRRPRDLIKLREGEELDGLGLVKRFAEFKEDVKFDSTIEIAGMPYQAKVERLSNSERVKQALDDIRSLAVAAGLKRDKAELLYEHESRDIFKNDPDRARDLADRRDKLYKLCGQPEAPYYALLKADGDSMGERISGLDLPEHKELSSRLSLFATEVRDRLEGLDCMPIFAGGDDVLAAIPLHRLIEAAEAVSQTFSTLVQTGTTPLTLSAGVAIVHALDPLDEGLVLAREAEKQAKGVHGKDAICLVAVPRSGASVAAAGKWSTMMPLLRKIDDAFRGDRLSFGFAHELRELLGRTPADVDEVLPQLAQAIAKRKKKEDSDAPGLIEEACKREDVEYREAIQHLLNCMLVTRKISRASIAAFGKPGEAQ